MKFKKLLSLAVAGAMVLAMSVPAFAFGGGDNSGGSSGGSGTEQPQSSDENTSTSEDNKQIGVTSSIEIPTVKVTVPNAGAVVLNPYRMQFTIPGTTDTSKAAFYNAPVICTNQSTADLRIAAKVRATVGGGVTLVDNANDAKAGKDPGNKNVYLYLKTGTANAADATSITEKTELQLKIAAKDTDYSFGPSGSTVEKYLEMPYKEDATYFGFQLDGAANTFTTDPWTAEDTISVTIVLTFTPMAIAANNT